MYGCEQAKGHVASKDAMYSLPHDDLNDVASGSMWYVVLV